MNRRRVIYELSDGRGQVYGAVEWSTRNSRTRARIEVSRPLEIAEAAELARLLANPEKEPEA